MSDESSRTGLAEKLRKEINSDRDTPAVRAAEIDAETQETLIAGGHNATYRQLLRWMAHPYGMPVAEFEEA